MPLSKTSLRFKLVDAFYIVMMLLPLFAGILLQVLTKPATEGIAVTGARIFFEIPMPIQNLLITEAQVNSVIAILFILFLCLFFTHGMTERIEPRRQHLAELAVQKVNGLVLESMGEYFKGFTPFIIGIMALSAVSSLLSLLGLFPPTSDINIVGGWAILVFILITYYKLKCGPVAYLKSFAQPVALLAPINLVSEIATPVSMAFRHYGNVLSGTVISVLLGSALAGLSSMLLGWLPGFLGDIPLLKFGIPAVLSLYFDLFSGCLQAFIFAMLTMMYVGGAFDITTFMERQARKRAQNTK